MQERSKGLLAYASNTDTVDYVSIAKQTLELASAQLGIPYTLITPPAVENWSNYRIDVDTHRAVAWNNFNRYMCYEQSPYDQTIVIDVDYLVLTPRLNLLFDTPQDLVLCHNNTFLYNPVESKNQLDPVWATVFYFTKTEKSQAFFYLVGKIQRNWEYYRILFSLSQKQFRNDYAFAMAELIINGYGFNKATRMPLSLLTVDKTPEQIDLGKDWLVIRDSDKANILPRQDLHVMSKSWLQSKHLSELISKAMP